MHYNSMCDRSTQRFVVNGPFRDIGIGCHSLYKLYNSFPPTIGIYAASQWVGLNLTIKSCAESALPAQLTAANGKLPISTCDRELSNYVTDVMANHGGHVIRNHALESETPAPRG